MFFNTKEKINLETLRPYFDAQKKILLEKNYPALLNVAPQDFESKLETVWKLFCEKTSSLKINKKGSIPLLLVVAGGDLAQKIKTINGHTELDVKNIKNS